MATAPAPPLVLAILAALVEERTGLHYGPADRSILAEKTMARAQEAGFESLLDYYYYLRYDPRREEELSALVDALVVRESYFFREYSQIEAVASLAAERVAAGERPRIWCAACAAGEEPLTLAMVLADRGLASSVDLVASDISAASLARARSGRYSPRSLRDVPAPRLAARYLRRESDASVRADEELCRAIQWRQINLTNAAEVASVGPCDLVLCRNVLIYFCDATVTRVVEAISAALRPGGALFVGISESLLRFGTSLVCEEHGDVFLYRKPA